MNYNSIFDTNILKDPGVTVAGNSDKITLTIRRTKTFVHENDLHLYKQLAGDPTTTVEKTLIYEHQRTGRIVVTLKDGDNKRFVYEGTEIKAQKFMTEANRYVKKEREHVQQDNTQRALDFLNDN